MAFRGCRDATTGCAEGCRGSLSLAAVTGGGLAGGWRRAVAAREVDGHGDAGTGVGGGAAS